MPVRSYRRTARGAPQTDGFASGGAPPGMFGSPSDQILDSFRSKPTPAAPSRVPAAHVPAHAVRVGASTSSLEEIARLKQEVADLNAKFNDWDSVLREMTQSVYFQTGTCMVDNVPYYIDLPEDKQSLRTPVGRIEAGERVTLLYPQYNRSDMLYMRIRRCHPRSGEMQQYYTPIANRTLTPHELSDLVGINTAATQYYDYFHIPGEDDPNPEYDQ